MNKKLFDISVIMPSLNEQDNIRFAVANVRDTFQKAEACGELILVNDGSNDKTLEIMHDLKKEFTELNIKILSHSIPMGIGKSFWDGVKIASSPAVVMLPGDGENDGYEILKYLPLLKHVDLIIPYVANGAKRTSIRRLLSKTYITLVNIIFATSFRYTNGTVLYRKSILENITLNSHGFFFQTELIMKCSARKYFYAEVPYLLGNREKGRSTAVSFRNLFKIITGLISTWAYIFIINSEPLPVEDSVTFKQLVK